VQVWAAVVDTQHPPPPTPPPPPPTVTTATATANHHSLPAALPPSPQALQLQPPQASPWSLSLTSTPTRARNLRAWTTATVIMHPFANMQECANARATRVENVGDGRSEVVWRLGPLAGFPSSASREVLALEEPCMRVRMHACVVAR
jgi:hypothetical protein